MKRFQKILLTLLLVSFSATSFADVAPGIKKGGKFSINDSTQVRFSMGNLQYCPKENTWRFADNQYDILEKENTNAGLSYFERYLDLFGWGTSGYDGKKPYSSSKEFTDYAMSGQKENITGTNYDWGIYCAISNGGGKPGMWRTPTVEEFEYLTRYRKDGIYLWGRAKLTIAEKTIVEGTILLPDDWKLPDGVTFVTAYEASKTNSNNYVKFESNNLTLDDWKKLENAGAIFLPYSGARNGVSYGSLVGGYWTTTASTNDAKNAVRVFDNLVSSTSVKGNTYRYYGNSVRLIRDIHYFQVTYLDKNGEILRVDSIEEFYSAEPPVLKDEISESYKITYTGWDQDLTSITKDIVTKPLFTKVDRNFYTVVFLDINGDTIRKDVVEEGSSITNLPELKDETTTDYILTYSGWDQTLTNIKKNLVVKPVYTKVDRSYYTVIFVDYYGDTLQTSRVEKGESVTAPTLKDETTDNFTLVYSGWEKSSSNIQSDMTIKAKYNVTYNLKIAGIAVTSNRCSDLTGQKGVIKEGKDAYLRYVPETNTLEMKNITITTTDVTWAIFNDMNDLTIKISGYNKLITPYCISLRTDRSLTITGTLQDTLMMYNDVPESSKDMAYATFASLNSHSLSSLPVTINSCALTCSGAIGVSVQELNLRNAYLYAESFGTPPSDAHKKLMYAFVNCSKVNLVACEVANPAKAYFSSSLSGFTTNGTSLLREVEIVPTGLPHTVTYMNGETVVRIDTFYQGEKITKSAPKLNDYKKDGKYYEFKDWDQSVYGKTIAEDIVINAKWLAGYDLVIASVRVTDENRNDILADFEKYYNESGWRQDACLRNGDCDNQHAVVSYDPTTNVLTFDILDYETNSYYYTLITSGNTGNSFYNGIPDLTIRFKGNLWLVSEYNPTFQSSTSITIEGDGVEQSKLKLSDGFNFSFDPNILSTGLIAETVNIKNCSVEIEAAMGCEAKEFTISNANFSTSTGYNELLELLKDEQKEMTHSFKCSSLTLSDMEITEPEGAYFDETLKGITVDGNTLTKEKVVFSVKAISTDTPSVMAEESGIYPNPAVDYVTVKGVTDEEVTIYDALGRCVMIAHTDNGVLNVSPLDNGIYMLKVANQVHQLIIRK